MVGIRKDFETAFAYPKEQERVYTVKDAIGDLPPLKSGEESAIPNHKAMKHSPQMLKKMSYVKDGGDRMDIPEELRPTSGDIRKYIRYDSTKPSVCVTGDMRKIFHYEQNRALTPRNWRGSRPSRIPLCLRAPRFRFSSRSATRCRPNWRIRLHYRWRRPWNMAKYPKVNYIGNKEKLSDWILSEMPVKEGTVLDLFAGGCSVSLRPEGRRLPGYLQRYSLCGLCDCQGAGGESGPAAGGGYFRKTGQ